MLIQGYQLDIEVSTHSAEEFEYEAIARLDVDLSPALPFLNAVLSRGIYLPESPALSWRHEGRNIGFWSDHIAVDHLESREQAAEIMDQLVDLVNRVWSKRSELQPDTTTHRRLQPLAIYHLLPRSNCKECGEATCFNFALKLAAGQRELAACAPLYNDPQWEGQRSRLESLVATRWPAL
jgi:ArsR family metal-binding transcriptional regulator